MNREKHTKSIPAMINQRANECTQFIWPFFRFFVVAIAWGAPFILLLGANSSPGVSPDPNLARILESLMMPILFVMSFFAVVGVLLLAALPRQVAPLSERFSLVFLVFGLIALGSYFGFFGLTLKSDPWIFSIAFFIAFTATILAFVVTPILGIWITANAIWRQSRRLAIAWALGYVFMVFGFFWLAGKTHAAEKDLGAGLIWAFGIGILLAVSFFASLIAFIRELFTKRKLGRQANGS